MQQQQGFGKNIRVIWLKTQGSGLKYYSDFFEGSYKKTIHNQFTNPNKLRKLINWFPHF